MDRIPLRDGKSTPHFADEVLAAFGNNPHGEPNYRLIWSERKMIWFMGEVIPEYLYLPKPCWVLEVWLSPEKDAGPQALWSEIHEATMGPYPRKGTYMFSQGFAEDWHPTETTLQALAAGLLASRDIPLEKRKDAIREREQEKVTAGIEQTAEAIVELQDSASRGREQTAGYGGKNTFRTPEDFGRDREKIEKEYAGMPKSGGKLIH